jgi:hypothetical protein
MALQHKLAEAGSIKLERLRRNEADSANPSRLKKSPGNQTVKCFKDGRGAAVSCYKDGEHGFCVVV